MEIVQSFALFKEGSPYLQNMKNKKKFYIIYLSFYCFLLSHITIKKLYGKFTMFGNKTAYDGMLKYIPYDAFEIMENTNNILMWNTYKLDVIKTIKDDFIHVDPDIMLFNNLLDPFINGECDLICQDTVSRKANRCKPFVFLNIPFFNETKILTKPYDGRAMSGGVLGLNKYAQEYYFAGVDVLYDAMVKHGLEDIDYASIILEEQLLYLISYENDFRVHSIIDGDDIDTNIIGVGEKVGYIHMWRDIKYKTNTIKLIREKIYRDYPEYYDFILKYENEVLSKLDFFKHLNFPLIYA